MYRNPTEPARAAALFAASVLPKEVAHLENIVKISLKWALGSRNESYELIGGDIGSRGWNSGDLPDLMIHVGVVAPFSARCQKWIAKRENGLAAESALFFVAAISY